VPPKVWEWDTENGGRFARINRPIAGLSHDKVLPLGEHDLQLHSLATPNGVKASKNCSISATQAQNTTPG
jgi:GST-like protein